MVTNVSFSGVVKGHRQKLLSLRWEVGAPVLTFGVHMEVGLACYIEPGFRLGFSLILGRKQESTDWDRPE